MGKLSPEEIRHALVTARKLGLVEVRLEEDESEFRARLRPQKVRPKAAAGTVAGSVEANLPEAPLVKSPLVGYWQPAKGIEVGARVSAGQIVGAILALGLLTDVESTAEGEIAEIVAANEPVEFGQTLLVLRPANEGESNSVDGNEVNA